MVPVAVAEDDHLDVAGGDPQPPHVLDHSPRGHAGVEQKHALALALAEADERREARFCDQRVGYAALRARARVGPRDSAQQRPRSVDPRDPLLVHQERIGQVVDEDRELDPIYGLKLDYR